MNNIKKLLPKLGYVLMIAIVSIACNKKAELSLEEQKHQTLHDLHMYENILKTKLEHNNEALKNAQTEDAVLKILKVRKKILDEAINNMEHHSQITVHIATTNQGNTPHEKEVLSKEKEFKQKLDQVKQEKENIVKEIAKRQGLGTASSGNSAALIFFGATAIVAVAVLVAVIILL